MILIVPIAPEVPKPLYPKLWQGLIMVLALCIAFAVTLETMEKDYKYVNKVHEQIEDDDDGKPIFTDEINQMLSLRPLLNISPSRGSWNVEKLILGNFVHGNLPHLLFNLIGIFAGARLCATFVPFACTFSIFLIGGSFGLLASLLMTPHATPYVPHVGASSGIFAMMGAYYIYNFRYRTKYFFWFPSRNGLFALQTSWFFFVDVLLLELMLSIAQVFPTQIDVIDHSAHVVGFFNGMVLAYSIRWFQRWPFYIQTRTEFFFWTDKLKRKVATTPQEQFRQYCEILDINFYNDLTKKNICLLIQKHSKDFSDAELDRALLFLSPTFVRLHTQWASILVETLLDKERVISSKWLQSLPYDSILRICQKMVSTKEKVIKASQLVTAYHRNHPLGTDTDRKVELLLQKLTATGR